MRQATVRATDLSDGRSFCRSAESAAAERGSFDYSDGTRSVDHLWEPVERSLGPAIDWVRRTIRPTAQTLRGDEALQHLSVVQQYVADITVRSPGFDRACAEAGLSVDDIQDLRAGLVPQRRTVEWASPVAAQPWSGIHREAMCDAQGSTARAAPSARSLRSS